MALSPALATAFGGRAVTAFAAIQIELPNHTIRLLDGSGVLMLNGQTFAGSDPKYGAISSVESFSDGLDAEAPTLQVTLGLPSNVSTAEVADPAAQGSRVSAWIGAVDPITGVSIGDAELVFAGELDTAMLTVGQNTRSLALTCVSAFERMFSDDEGVRLNDAFHQSIWPGETGLVAASAVRNRPYWGAQGPTPAVSATSSGGGSIVGGIGGGLPLLPF